MLFVEKVVCFTMENFAGILPGVSSGKGGRCVQEIKYVIKGDPRTKKNSLMIAGKGKRCPKCGKFEKQWVRQGKAHSDFAEAALWQLRPRPKSPIEARVNVKCLFYMKTRRRVDTLNLLASIDDILVGAGVLADDNSSIVVAHDGSRVLYDSVDPRTEITITLFPEDEQLKLF